MLSFILSEKVQLHIDFGLILSNWNEFSENLNMIKTTLKTNGSIQEYRNKGQVSVKKSLDVYKFMFLYT